MSGKLDVGEIRCRGNNSRRNNSRGKKLSGEIKSGKYLVISPTVFPDAYNPSIGHTV